MVSASDPEEYVVNKALMYCTEGTARNQLAVTPRHVRTGDNAYGNVHDKVGGVNIPAFGFCRKKGGRCFPKPTEWRNYDKTRTCGACTLLVKSEIPCTEGGLIKFETSGQQPLTADEEQALSEEQNAERERWAIRRPAPSPKSFRDAVAASHFPVLANLAKASQLKDQDRVLEALGQVFGASPPDSGDIPDLLPLGGTGFSRTSLRRRFQQAKQHGKRPVEACFTGETLVHCEGGAKRIDAIEVGERVWSFDENHGSDVLSEVLDVYSSTVNQLIELVAGNTTVRTTPEHPFMCKGQWVPASSICVGDHLQTTATAAALRSRRYVSHLHHPVNVFNLNVEITHNYYVGVDRVLVHNMCHGDRARRRLNELQEQRNVAREERANIIRRLDELLNGANPNHVNEGLNLVQRGVEVERLVDDLGREIDDLTRGLNRLPR